MKKSSETVVILRVFPGMNKPNPLGLEKLNLFERCMRSLAVSIGSTPVRLEVLLDSCPDAYEKALQVFPDTVEISVYKFQELGNGGSFKKQLEIACALPDSTVVVILEDDYFWTQEGFGDLLSFVRSGSRSLFATPYHHPDYETLPIHKRRMESKDSWRSAISTTCTFAAKAQTIKENIILLERYQELNDFGMWLCITRVGLLPSLALLSGDSEQSKLGVTKDWLVTWFYFVSRFLWRIPSTPLFYPIKSGATHMDSNYIGLGVEWPFDRPA